MPGLRGIGRGFRRAIFLRFDACQQVAQALCSKKRLTAEGYVRSLQYSVELHGTSGWSQGCAVQNTIVAGTDMPIDAVQSEKKSSPVSDESGSTNIFRVVWPLGHGDWANARCEWPKSAL